MFHRIFALASASLVGLAIGATPVASQGILRACDGSTTVTNIASSSSASVLYQDVPDGALISLSVAPAHAAVNGEIFPGRKRPPIGAGSPLMPIATHGATCSGAACSGLTYTNVGDGNVVFARVGNDFDDDVSLPISSGSMALPPVSMTTSCTPAAGGGDGSTPGATGGGAAATASGAAIGGAIGTRLSGNGGNGNVEASQNRLFVSTRGQDSDLVGWFSIEGRKFDGSVDGSGLDLTLGFDVEISPHTLLGFVLSFGDYDLTVGANTVEIESLTFGPYFATRIDDMWSMDGFVTYAAPKYNVSGTRYKAERWAAQVKVNAEYLLHGVEAKSFLALSGFTEDHPAAGAFAARDVSSYTGSLGTKFTFNPGQDLRPYISIAADFNSFDDGVAGSVTNASPRLGFGLTHTGAQGVLQLDFDVGEISKGTKDYGLRLRYEMQF